MKYKNWLSNQPMTLAMSSGFFGFFAHAGMAIAMRNQGFAPQHICGSSAGALIGVMLAKNLSDEEIQSALFTMSKKDFWDVGLGLGLLKGEKFRAKLRDILGVEQFSELDIPFSVSAYNLHTKRTECFSDGNLIEAVYASCAVPILFQPATINGVRYLDGGIKDRPGTQSAPDDLPILYQHIASKSPWRKTVPLPSHKDLNLISLLGLPRTGPNKLYLAREIYHRAFEATDRALESEYNNWLYINA